MQSVLAHMYGLYVHLSIYLRSYQSKVSIAGTFTALSSMVVAKMRKLSYWCCCKYYSCECCSVLFSRFRLIGRYNGIFRL